jgi:hypothetical protein
MSDEVGGQTLRAEVVDRVVKGFAAASYKFKQALSLGTTNAWTNTFWQEDADVLPDRTGNDTKGIPRGANFPQSSVNWTRVSKWLEKYGAEDNIYWEDTLTSEIDVQSRTLFRIAEKVTKAVDDEIWEILTDGRTGTLPNIQSFRITEQEEWTNAASAAVVDDLMRAKQLIGVKNYSTANLMCFLSERDHRSVVNYVHAKGAQYDTLGEDMAKNGRVPGLAGIKFVVSNSVTASYALVVVPKICASWKSLVPLTTNIEIDPFKSTRIRAVEVGVTQLTDPNAVVLIMNTQRTADV